MRALTAAQFAEQAQIYQAIGGSVSRTVSASILAQSDTLPNSEFVAVVGPMAIPLTIVDHSEALATDTIALSELLRILEESSDRFHSFGRPRVSGGVVLSGDCESAERYRTEAVAVSHRRRRCAEHFHCRYHRLGAPVRGRHRGTPAAGGMDRSYAKSRVACPASTIRCRLSAYESWRSLVFTGLFTDKSRTEEKRVDDA